MCPFLILPWWDLGAPSALTDWKWRTGSFQVWCARAFRELCPPPRHHCLFVFFSGILRCGTTVPTPPSFSWAPNSICGMTRTRLKSWRRRSWLPSPTHRALPWQKRSVWQRWGYCWLDLGCVCGRPCTLIKWNECLAFVLEPAGSCAKLLCNCVSAPPRRSEISRMLSTYAARPQDSVWWSHPSSAVPPSCKEEEEKMSAAVNITLPHPINPVLCSNNGAFTCQFFLL